MGLGCYEMIGVGDVETKGHLICCIEARRLPDTPSREVGVRPR